MMNTARNIAHWRKVWRNALIAHGVDVSAVPDSAVAVWPLSVGKPARYALALTSRQASPDTATVAPFAWRRPRHRWTRPKLRRCPPPPALLNNMPT